MICSVSDEGINKLIDLSPLDHSLCAATTKINPPHDRIRVFHLDFKISPRHPALLGNW